MLPSKDLAMCFLTLWIFINIAKCQDLKEMSKTLDEMLVNSRSFRRPRDHEDTSVIWQEYEFGTEAGNREDVVVTNISLHTLTDISEKIDISTDNCQFLQTETSYFICVKNSTLIFYKINLDDLSSERVINILTEGHILQFKVLHFDVDATFNENHTNILMAILLVESQSDYFLYWYNIFGTVYTLYSTWPIRKQIQDMEFVREENQYELLLLDNDDAYSEQSLIDVYSFDVDFKNHRIDIWFCRRLFVPKAFNIQVCPIYGRTVLAFQGIDNVVLYKSKNEDKLCQFEKLEPIQSNKVANLACFESGYTEYLAIGGEKLRLFHFLENDFQENTETNLHFNGTTEILWIVTIPLNTYRDESLLLVQLKDLTVIALAWHGSTFKTVSLSNQILNNFDLSKVVVIPKIGFVHINTLVRIEVALSESAHPIHHETESVLKTRVLLEEVFRKQEAIFDETEVRFNRSYLKNPMTAGFWNLSKVNVSNATIERHINYSRVQVGSINLEIKDILINVTSNLKKLEELEMKLDRILLNLKMDMTNSTRIILPSDIELNGDFLVNGTLYAKNITASFINDASTSIVANGIANRAIINGQKFFPSIDTNNLTILSLNGIPLEEIVFDLPVKNYSDINFSKLKRLKVDGHLNVLEVNNVKWEDLIQNIVWKDKSIIISGDTIVEELVAEKAIVKNLNRLQYPENYVLTSDKFSINITGAKHFASLTTAHLSGIEAINKINIDDFIILSRHEVIEEEITFEDLKIDGTFQIDGNVTGINVSGIEELLNETDSLLSDVIFENLTVMGNIVLKHSINAKTWSDLDDFLFNTERDAVIIGNKKFLSDVTIKPRATIKSRRINDHLLSEFVTLNTNQQFPHLIKMSANVTFGNVTLDSMEKLEDYITHEQNIASGCLNKILLFVKSSIIDYLSFDTIQQTISQKSFFDKVNKTFHQVHFENLTISTLLTDEILPKTINGINYTDLAKWVLTLYTRQNLTGTLIVDNLETDILNTEIINGIHLNTWNVLLMNAKSLYEDVFEGNALIKSLQVTGVITATWINNNDIIDIYKEDNMATVIFNENVSIENLRVIGFVNNLSLSEFIVDTVRKADRNVTFIDCKTLKNVTCEFLQVSQFINGHFVNDILDPNEKQTLKGPIVINGSVTVFTKFNTTGKIGNSIFLSDFTDRLKTLENNSYALRGNFHFNETVSVTRLNVSGSIQGSTLDNFLETVIFRNDENVTISALKSLKNSVTFNDIFNIDGSLNDLDLHRFHENVVYVDKPFSINTNVTFREDVYLQKNLVVEAKLQSNTIMEVDIKDLQENVIVLNKPKYIPARMTLDNVTFQTSIKLVQINDLQVDLLILLNTQQFIMIDKLNCINITVEDIQILGRINSHYIGDIYADTFMIYGNQNVTGDMKIRGTVHAHHDFNAHLINNFNPTKIASLTANDTLTGNFMFKTSIVLDKSLKILGLLNKISPINWQGITIKTTDKANQIISAKWTVYGNVHFEKNVDGNEYLNGINVTNLSLALAQERPKMDHVIEAAYEDLSKICAFHLDTLKCNARNQIYKFNTFDYLNIQEFEGDIHDIHNVDVNDVDYMLVNYNTCHIKLLSYTQTDFQVIDEVADFGLIDQWRFFKSNRVLYLLTIAKRACNRSLNNIWKLENNRLTHVLDLGNGTNMNLYQDEFVAMIQENFEAASKNVPDILKALISYKNEKLNFVSNSALANQSFAYELQERSSNGTRLKNCLGCGSTLTFNVGIYEREEYIYYDEEVSQNYIYLCKNDVSQTRILQTIKVHRPKSFLILNFGGSVETLLVFIENNDVIQIYEYAGIEGFVHRNMMQIKVDEIYNIKVRKYNNLEKTHCLAVVNKNRLTILEAKMYGEKLDLKMIGMDSCFTNSC